MLGSADRGGEPAVGSQWGVCSDPRLWRPNTFCRCRYLGRRIVCPLAFSAAQVEYSTLLLWLLDWSREERHLVKGFWGTGIRFLVGFNVLWLLHVILLHRGPLFYQWPWLGSLMAAGELTLFLLPFPPFFCFFHLLSHLSKHKRKHTDSSRHVNGCQSWKCMCGHASQNRANHWGEPSRPLREAEGRRPHPGRERILHHQHVPLGHRQPHQGGWEHRHATHHPRGRWAVKTSSLCLFVCFYALKLWDKLCYLHETWTKHYCVQAVPENIIIAPSIHLLDKPSKKRKNVI